MLWDCLERTELANQRLLISYPETSDQTSVITIEITSEDIIDKFQGAELKSHFEKILNGTIRASIKPQIVSMIPKAFRGTAKQLSTSMMNAMSLIE